jgi:hypothetical protein
MEIKSDSGIEWIREIRHKISEEHLHDPKQLVTYYLELQKKYKERVIENAEEAESTELINA